MSRQHAVPILVPAIGSSEPLRAAAADWSEDRMQTLVHDHPACLPIREIDQLFADPVPLCREMTTAVGSIDNILITPSGLPVLVECKLWRNPQARREVIGQILDYATALSRWTASDLQREISRRTGHTAVDLVRAAGHVIDEISFTDALTLNLRRGRFLLLIVGDGIREGVEAITEYLQAHSGLHFTLGLVEMPVFQLPDGSRLVAPRVLAKTETITRTVIVVPEGHAVVEDASAASTPEDEERKDPTSRIAFWTDFVRDLTLDDPEQPKPRAGRQGYVTLSMPVPGGNCWMVSYRSEPKNRVGVYLSHAREGIGARINERLVEDAADILTELGGTAHLQLQPDDRRLFNDATETGPWTIPAERERALAWLRSRTNDFVNVLRPRLKIAVRELGED